MAVKNAASVLKQPYPFYMALFDEFDPVSKKDWLKKVTADLKGKDLETLDHQWAENIRLSPFFHQEDNPSPLDPLKRNSSLSWLIGEGIEADEVETANKTLLEGLEQGVNAPELTFSKPIDPEQWASLLKGVRSDYISLFLKPMFSGTDLVTWLDGLLTYLGKEEIPPANRKGALLLADPDSDIWEMWPNLLKRLPGYCFIQADGIGLYNREDPAAEIAGLASQAYDLLKQAEASGIDPGEAHARLIIRISIGTGYFRALTKIRAFKILWANILQAKGWKADKPPFLDVHFHPSGQDADEHTNMIRSTSQAIAAVVAGADRLCIPPADWKRGVSTGQTRRIARNIHHILAMESHIGQVEDPAAGSYFLDNLSKDLAEKAFDKLA